MSNEAVSRWLHGLPSIISIINMMIAKNPTKQGTLIVRRNRDVAKGTGAMLSPNDWKLGATITDRVVLTMYKMTGTKGWNNQKLWVPNIKFPNNIETQTLSLLSRVGDVGLKSGINWGQRKGRNPNQAYIPLPAKIARSGFFPLNKQHFTVITDDHHQLILRVEQAGDKAITTPLSNAQLGEYFRNRLNLANGAFISKSDLEKYGRSDITFYKLDDEQYYMDFSV